MPLRKKFKSTDHAWLVPGSRVMWLNASTWRPAVVRDGAVIEADDQGYQFILLVDQGRTTRTFTSGQVIRGYAGHVRSAGGI